jgi:nucleoside-diphosphate-sugar epimerase
MKDGVRTIAITGANGYIGSRLCRAAIAANWNVLALGRRPISGKDVTFAPYDFARAVEVDLLKGVDALVHLAADTRSANPDPLVEVAACRNLIQVCTAANVRLIFVSSQTARADSPTGYGRLKWQLERLVLEARGLVVRPGMVYGGPEAGLFGSLCGLVRVLPVLPALFMTAPIVQPTHVDDLANALLAAASLDPQLLSDHPYEIADRDSISFTQFLKAIARCRVRKVRLFVPFPTVVVRLVAGLAFRLTRNSKIDPLRLESLLGLQPMNCSASNAALQFHPRRIGEGMHPTGSNRRRRVTQEGRSLLTYLCGETPSAGMVARYVRAVERFDDGNALEINALVHLRPSMLALVEGPRIGGRDQRIGSRIDLAFQIAEASTLTRRFLSLRTVAWPMAVLYLAGHVFREAATIPLRSIIGPLLHSAATRDRKRR